MRRQFEDEICSVLVPYLDNDTLSDVMLKITMVCGNYDIAKTETALTVYEGDVNEQMLKRFLLAKIARGLSERTIDFYKKSITFFFDRIDKAYYDITPDDIRLYLAIRVQKDGVTKTTANNEFRAASSFYTWLQNEEILLKNPMAKVEKLKDVKKKKKAFSPLEVEQIRYACVTVREKALVELLLSTWARVSEITQIKRADLDGNKILVHGKGGKERDVYMNARAQMAMERYLQERSDNNPYIFPRAKYAGDVAAMCRHGGHNRADWYKKPELVGEGPTDKGTIEMIIRRIGKDAKVEKTHPHRFRRTGATMALRAGMPLINVSKILGHESIATTQIYLDISDKELEQMHEKYVG